VVIGRVFAWGHIGRAAGETTLALFQLFPELVVHADLPHTSETHTTFVARRDQIEGKTLVLNIRRLPSWILSYAHWKSRWGVHPDYKPTPMQSPYEMSRSAIADRHLQAFTWRGEFTIDRWLRAEYIRNDFLDFISDHTKLTDEQRARVLESEALNSLDYDREISHWFTREQVELMYHTNPVWAEVETNAYGSTMLEML
jgi:hypothetical protein